MDSRPGETFFCGDCLCEMPGNLTRTQLALLNYLRERAGKVVSREELAHAVWRSKFDPRSRSIDQTVSFVRKSLSRRERIRSVMGCGYKYERL